MKRREWVMLAHPVDFEKDRIAGRMMSEKLDGQRAIWDGGITRGLPVGQVPWANTAKDHRRVEQDYLCTGLWSRYGNVIHAPDSFLDGLPNFPLDGELWIGPGTYQELRSIVSRFEPDERWNKVTLYAIDFPCYEELFAEGRVVSGSHYEKIFDSEIIDFVAQMCREKKCANAILKEMGFALRRDKIRFWLGKPEGWVIHEQEKLPMQTDAAEARIGERMDEVLLTKGEGLILRTPHSRWQPKRTRDVLKVKPYHDDEAVVLGYTWGKETDKGSRLLGLMGTLIVEWKGIEFELGSGFTDAERELTEVNCGDPGQVVPDDINNPEFPRGTLVTFKYRELSDDGVPKEATYFRRR